jgi:hypothetical protein
LRPEPLERQLRRVRAIGEETDDVPLPCMMTLQIHEHSRREQGRQRTARVKSLVLGHRSKRCRRLDDRQLDVITKQHACGGGAEVRERHERADVVGDRCARKVLARRRQGIVSEHAVNGTA